MQHEYNILLFPHCRGELEDLQVSDVGLLGQGLHHLSEPNVNMCSGMTQVTPPSWCPGVLAIGYGYDQVGRLAHNRAWALMSSSTDKMASRKQNLAAARGEPRSILGSVGICNEATRVHSRQRTMAEWLCLSSVQVAHLVVSGRRKSTKC